MELYAMNLQETGRPQRGSGLWRKVASAAILTLGIVPFAIPTAHAGTVTGRAMTMAELAQSSDEIVHGTVEKVEASFRNGRIETDATIAVREGFKGTRYSLGRNKVAENPAQAPRFTLTTLGGTLPNIPIAQHMSFTPNFAQGEEVVLFLRYPESDPVKRDKALSIRPNSKLPVSPRIVGYFQGKFSVYKDDVTGRRYVSRFQLDGLGLAPTSKTQSSTLKALRSGRLKVSETRLVADTPEKAPQLSEIASPRTSTVAPVASEKAIAANLGTTVLPVQDFNAFVTQIKEVVK